MRLIQTAAVLLITCLFALTWGVVLRDRLESGQPTTPVQGYEGILADGVDSRRVVMGIYLGRLRIGGSDTEITRQDGGWVRIVSRTALDVGSAASALGGAAGTVNVQFAADVSPMTGLRAFDATSEELGLRLFGNVTEGRLAVRGTFGSDFIQTDLDYPEGLVLGDALSPLNGLSKPTAERIGETWAMPFFNPLTGSIDDVKVRLSKYSDLQAGAELRRFFKLTFFGRGVRWNAWVDEQGEVIVQGTPLPLGIMLRREDLAPGLVDALLALDGS